MASFVKATKQQAKLRMALIGPAGSGKTYTALTLATKIGKRVALIDTERGSASHYANKFEFDTCQLDSFHPQQYIEAIRDAEAAGYDVIIVDSLSQAWSGKDGALELVDRAAKRSQSGNSFGAWRDVTPLHNQLVDAMVGCKANIIVTMRTKMEYVQEKDERGKTSIRKVGLQPVQRDGLEYEFDVVADMTIEHDCLVTKTRCEALTDAQFRKPGADMANIITTWLSDGTAPAPKSVQEVKNRVESGPLDDLERAVNKLETKQPLAAVETPSAALIAAYLDRVKEARALGIHCNDYEEGISKTDLTEAGKNLKAEIARVKADREPFPGHGG